METVKFAVATGSQSAAKCLSATGDRRDRSIMLSDSDEGAQTLSKNGKTR